MEEQIPLSQDHFSFVLRKLIDSTSRAPAGEAGLRRIYQETLSGLDSIGVERASILLFDPDGVMRFKAWLGISDHYRQSVEGHTPWSRDDFNPPPLITSDIYHDPSLKPHLHIFESENIRALAFIPLLYRGRVIGKFMLYSRVPYDFKREIDAANAIAQLVAYSVVRKKIEDQLSLSESRLKAILDNEPDCVAITDATGVMKDINPAGRVLLEADDTLDIIGRNIFPMVVETDRARAKALLSRVSNGEKASLEFEITTLKGTRLFVETHAVPFFSDEYENVMILSITRDITDKKKVEAQREQLLMKEKEARLGAEKSVQLRDDFLSIASHELRTPLTPILMNFQLVEKYLRAFGSQVPRMEQILKVVENTDQQFGRFLKLVENLLDVSRITADRFILNKEVINLSSLIRDIAHRFKMEFEKAHCELKLEIQNGVLGYFDRVRMEQVVNNLLSNAIKYGANCPVKIALSSKGNRVQLIVTDHGIGIEEQNQSKIFSRFERVASSNYYGGLGLGLFITNNIVKAHGGTIKVESTLGKGATFTVDLPLQMM
ncbi:ATP-binding protein [Peredibacter sp. HCB2-198]|uniref:sensor histidine kinase n=1 Tax=Peredibacter sp. HCB2-198 TaxID=3383025 RepID=UPI0038B503D7